LEDKREFYITGMKKAIETLESLLEVRPVQNYGFSDEELLKFEINKWDKNIIGNETDKGMADLDIDLFIFIKFANSKELGENVLAVATPIYYDSQVGQTLLGIAGINRDLDFEAENSLRFFESVILHEFTHILGFTREFFVDIYHNYYVVKDTYGERAYINSSKVIEVAKKYFNCPSIKGIQLEEYGESGTFGSHWEEKILLGEYMTGVAYEEEQIISEFTLALLEDTGNFKANYYTGGLMKYGKNKGCDFINSKCVKNGNINSKFDNEYFDGNNKKYGLIDPSCTSGRQSRVYSFLIEYFQSFPIQFQYYSGQPRLGGPRPSADYCPVFSKDIFSSELNNIYYVGHCSELGSELYGSAVSYNDKKISNGKISSITGEYYSNESFCVLSSLLDKKENNYRSYLNQVHSICYQMHCSDKSLTIQIKKDFIVCPRAGGKIKVQNYEGYLLCPDYYLICSGTVLCNDMFDCVEKKSLLKDDIKYDYDIKTRQNILSSEKEKFSENYYELSNNGICPQNCSLCREEENETINCIEWRKGDKQNGKDNDNYKPSNEDDDDDDDDKKILYIVIGSIGFVIIVIVIFVIIKLNFKKNVNLREEVYKTSFEQPRDDDFQGEGLLK
jgi:hypothetical protein